jgi:hypothetical protein
MRFALLTLSHFTLSHKLQHIACPFLQIHELLIKIPAGVCAFLISLTDCFVLSLLNYVLQADKIHG